MIFFSSKDYTMKLPEINFIFKRNHKAGKKPHSVQNGKAFKGFWTSMEEYSVLVCKTNIVNKCCHFHNCMSFVWSGFCEIGNFYMRLTGVLWSGNKQLFSISQPVHFGLPFSLNISRKFKLEALKIKSLNV